MPEILADVWRKRWRLANDRAVARSPDGRGENWVLVDVGGVGYMVEGSARLLDGCPPDGEAVSLAIETYVREDQFRLFGF